MRRPSRREAYLVGALLVLAAVPPLALRSGAWIERFARGPSLVDLDARFAGSARREGGELVVLGGRRPIAAVLTPFAGEPGRHYLLQLRTVDSPPLTVNLIGPGWDRIEGPFRRGAGGGVKRILLRPDRVPAGTRLHVAFRPPGKLRIAALEVRELSPAYRWVGPLVLGVGPLVALVFGVRHRRWLLGRAGPPAPLAARDRALLAAAIFLVCLLVFYQAPVAQVFDAQYLTVVSHSLLTFGTTGIPGGLLAVNPAEEYQLIRVGEQTVHFFSHAPAVLNAPFVWMYGLFGVRPVDAAGAMQEQAETQILRFCAAFVAAALCLVLYGIGRRWLAAGPALLLVAVFGFGTQILSTISRPYWSHAWASLLLACALYLLADPRARERPWAYAAIASLLSWAFFCRPIMALSVVAVTLFVARRRRTLLPWLVVPGLLWAILFVVHSQQVFGQLLPGYFLSWHLYTGRLALPTESLAYPEALVGTLFSPSRGLFVFVPFFLPVLWAVARRWRRLPDRGLALAALGVIALHWQVISSFRNWWGGAAYGPRLFSDVVVWFFVLAVLALAAAGREPESRPSFRRPLGQPLGRLAVALVVAFSLFVQARGAFDRATIQWPGSWEPGLASSERHPEFRRKIWDWRDPQFLAGLHGRSPQPR